MPGSDPALSSTRRVLGFVNTTHHLRYELAGRLPGSHQSGAYLLRDPGSARCAVLKWSTDRSWAEQVRRAAPMVAHARAGGWPTPAWLAAGTTPRGFPYQVQELAPGVPAGRLAGRVVADVLRVVETQAGLASPTDRDWSEYDRRVVFAGESGFAARLRGFSATAAALVDRLDAWAAPWRDTRWPATDLVHGDLNPDNILVADGRVSALIDVEALGAGSRVHDVATLIMYAWLATEPGDLGPLLVHAHRIARPGELAVHLGSCLLGLLAFGADRWPADVRETARAMARLVDDLAAGRTPTSGLIRTANRRGGAV
jgi:aminoglycoside phosphotransferase (APT) family kinase protein